MHARASEAPLARAGAWLRRAARHVIDRLLLIPLYEGRLQLRGVPIPVVLLSIVGLGVLCNLLVVLVFDDVWRAGDFVELATADGQRPRLMPVALTPVTLVALAAGWVLVVSGGTIASPFVRLTAAGFWLLANGASSRPLGSEEASMALEWAPQLVRGAYVAVAMVLVLYSIPIARDRWARRLAPTAAILASAGVVVFFGSQIWLHIDLVRTGGGVFGDGAESNVPSSLDVALRDVELMLLPLLYLSGVAVAEFAYDVASALIAPFEDIPARLARAAALALVIGKLALQHLNSPDYWLTIIRETPAAAVHTALAVSYLGAVVFLGRYLRRHVPRIDRVRESVAYSGAALVFLPAAVVVLLLNVHVSLLLQFRWDALTDLVDRRTSAPLERERVVLWLIAIAGALAMLRYRASNANLREAAFAILVVAPWGLAHDAWFAIGRRGSFDEVLIDFEVTVAALAILLLGVRRLSSRTAALVAGLVLFTWLATTQFGVLSLVSEKLGLGDAIVAVFGVVFALLAGSAFVRGHSRLLPKPSRPLIWIGYLVVSTAILNWIVASRTTDTVADVSAIGLFYLGYPLAAWIIARRGFAASDDEYAEAAAPEPRAAAAPVVA